MVMMTNDDDRRDSGWPWADRACDSGTVGHVCLYYTSHHIKT